MKKEDMYIRYTSVLTDNEIVLYSQILDLFRNEEIDYLTLKNMFASRGISIEPVLYDFSKKRMTVKEVENLKKRLAKEEYLYDEISRFILNSDNYKNVTFSIDYDAIEILANHKIPYYQEVMISILETRLKNSFDTNDEIKARRSMWKRRIKELKSELKINKDNKIIIK